MYLLWKASWLVLLLVFLNLSFSFAAAEATDSSLIEGAKKEGALVFYTSMTVGQAREILNAFQAKYPFLEPKIYRAVGERLPTKIMTDQCIRYAKGFTDVWFCTKGEIARRYSDR